MGMHFLKMQMKYFILCHRMNLNPFLFKVTLQIYK